MSDMLHILRCLRVMTTEVGAVCCN